MTANPSGPPQPDPPRSREPLDLHAVVLLVLAVGAGALAYRNPERWGVALTVGIAVALALHALIRRE